MAEMTTAEALAELRNAGYDRASAWSRGGLVTIYLNDGTRGQIWCRSIAGTVRNDNDVWAAIGQLINRK